MQRPQITGNHHPDFYLHRSPGVDLPQRVGRACFTAHTFGNVRSVPDLLAGVRGLPFMPSLSASGSVEATGLN